MSPAGCDSLANTFKGPAALPLYFPGEGFISQLASLESLKTHSGNDNPEKEGR